MLSTDRARVAWNQRLKCESTVVAGMVRETDSTAGALEETVEALEEAVDALAETVEEMQSESDEVSDEGFASGRKAVMEFAESHPNLSYDCVGHKQDHFWLTYSIDGRAPGCSNVGGLRADAEEALKDSGFELEIASLEETHDGYDAGLLLEVFVTPTSPKSE
jgi:hypothetical protein